MEMSKKVLFVSARPVSINDQLVTVLDKFVEAGVDVHLWTFFNLPEVVSGKHITISGPQYNSGNRNKSWILQLRPMRSSRKIFRIPRQLIVVKILAVKNKTLRFIRIRFRRELAWLTLKFSTEIRKQKFDVIVSFDSFSVFATWKLARKMKPKAARASLTHVASLLEND